MSSGWIRCTERLPDLPGDYQLMTLSRDGFLSVSPGQWDGETFHVTSFLFDPPETLPCQHYNCSPYAWAPLLPIPKEWTT